MGKCNPKVNWHCLPVSRKSFFKSVPLPRKSPHKWKLMIASIDCGFCWPFYLKKQENCNNHIYVCIANITIRRSLEPSCINVQSLSYEHKSQSSSDNSFHLWKRKFQRKKVHVVFAIRCQSPRKVHHHIKHRTRNHFSYNLYGTYHLFTIPNVNTLLQFHFHMRDEEKWWWIKSELSSEISAWVLKHSMNISDATSTFASFAHILSFLSNPHSIQSNIFGWIFCCQRYPLSFIS